MDVMTEDPVDDFLGFGLTESPPALETGLTEATATRDSTDIASGVPDGEAEVTHTPTISLGEAFSLDGVRVPDAGVSDPMTGGQGLATDEPATGPGLPDPELPGQQGDGPSGSLATLAAWAGVLTAAAVLLDRVGVISW